MNRYSNLLIALAAQCAAAPGWCAPADQIVVCAAVEDGDERLKCYDDYAKTLAVAPPRAAGADILKEAVPEMHAAASPASEKCAAVSSPDASYLARTWNLGPCNQAFTTLEPHRLNYLLFGRWSDNTSLYPASPSHPAGALPLDVQPNELKFQFSVKSELVGPETFSKYLHMENTRLWFAYTQQSHWQVYNVSASRPFRETNYEPELILTRALNNTGDGWKFVNLGLVHQSNGQSDPLSRSWNRVYLQGGWEQGPLSVLVRGWASGQKEDNPDINDYVGRAELVARWNGAADNPWMLSVLLRNNLKASSNRGYAQIDWRPFTFENRKVGLHLQATSGYGESLIDYNHRQSTFGLGISFVE